MYICILKDETIPEDTSPLLETHLGCVIETRAQTKKNVNRALEVVDSGSIDVTTTEFKLLQEEEE